MAVWMLVRRDLRRSLWSTFGLALIVALAAGTVMAGVAGAHRTRTALPRFVEEYRREDFLVYLDAPLAQQTELPARLEQVPGVASATGAAFGVFAPAEPREDAAFIGAVVFVDPHGLRQITRPLVVEGRLFDPEAPQEAIVNEEFASFWHLEVGSSFPMVAYAPDQLGSAANDPTLHRRARRSTSRSSASSVTPATSRSRPSPSWTADTSPCPPPSGPPMGPRWRAMASRRRCARCRRATSRPSGRWSRGSSMSASPTGSSTSAT